MSGILALLAAVQSDDPVALRPVYQKFDQVVVRCTVRTEVTSSNGRHSKYVMEAEFSSEVDRVEDGAAVFGSGVRHVKVTGTVDGREIEYEWRKGAAERGTAPGDFKQAFDKGWSVTLTDGGVAMSDAALALHDALPVFNPGVLLGLAVPPPAGKVKEGGRWEVPARRYPFFSGFSLGYAASLDLVNDGVATVSAQLAYARSKDEVPIAGGVNVRGKGFASMEYDLKAGRPKSGASSLTVHFGQGGLKRDVKQVIEYEVRE